MNFACYPSESTRLQMLHFFHNSFGIHHTVDTLNMISLPAFTLQVVNEIATAKAIPMELSLLGFLPSIAAADRGHSRVVMSDGSSNSLSLFMEAGRLRKHWMLLLIGSVRRKLRLLRKIE